MEKKGVIDIIGKSHRSPSIFPGPEKIDGNVIDPDLVLCPGIMPPLPSMLPDLDGQPCCGELPVPSLDVAKSSVEDMYQTLTPAEPPAWLENDDQRRIWKMYEECKILAIKKNHDYGSTVFKTPVMAPNMACGDAILVRMSDKIGRLRNLMSGAKQTVSDEGVRDTMKDLGTYAFLYVIAMDKEVTEKKG